MKNYKVKVIGSGFGGRIASIHINVEYDPQKDTMQDFFKKVCHASFIQGYNVLHLEDLNDVRGTKSIWACLECDRLCKKVLGLCDEISRHRECIAALKKAEDTGEDVPVGKQVASFNKYVGKYQIGGCAMDFFEHEVMRRENILAGINTALELLGFDIEDNAKRKRILDNLGFNKVDLGYGLM